MFPLQTAGAVQSVRALQQEQAQVGHSAGPPWERLLQGETPLHSVFMTFDVSWHRLIDLTPGFERLFPHSSHFKRKVNTLTLVIAFVSLFSTVSLVRHVLTTWHFYPSLSISFFPLWLLDCWPKIFQVCCCLFSFKCVVVIKGINMNFGCAFWFSRFIIVIYYCSKSCVFFCLITTTKHILICVPI